MLFIYVYMGLVHFWRIYANLEFDVMTMNETKSVK